MASDFNSLGLELGRLEIEPSKLVKKGTVENPFSNPSQKRNNKYSESIRCCCMVHKRRNNKKKSKEILRDPLLRLSQSVSQNISKTNDSDNSQAGHPIPNSKPDLICLHSLVNTCNMLSISPEKRHLNTSAKVPKDHTKWWKSRRSKMTNDRGTTKVESDKSSSSTCSQQALNPPPPCDVTIDELASYFETFVHIPKKMSTMAEMMYI